MKKKTMSNVIAAGVWNYTARWPKGRKISRIVIGRPRPDSDPKGDWICPIEIEHFTRGVVCAHGVGSLDALLNAMQLLRQFFDMNTVVQLAAPARRKSIAARSPVSARQINRRRQC